MRYIAQTVQLVLAIAIAAIALAATPATAQVAPGAVATVAVFPDGAGQLGQYTLELTSTSALPVSAMLTVSSTEVKLPAAAGNYFVVLGSGPIGGLPTSVDRSGTGHSVTFALPMAVPAGASFSVQISKAINPARPGTYSINVTVPQDFDLRADLEIVPTKAVANPSSNMSYSMGPASLPSCYVDGSTDQDWATLPCLQEQLAGIDRARASEGVPPMVLPGWFPKLTVPEQLLVVTDLERQARGLPIFAGLSASLDTMAYKGAVDGTDPTGPAQSQWGSNWAGGYPTALLANFGWMYDDGLGSGNLDCTAGNTTGCWGHRDNILGNFGPHPVMGAAVTSWHGALSMTELFATQAPGPLAWRLPANLVTGPGGIAAQGGAG